MRRIFVFAALLSLATVSLPAAALQLVHIEGNVGGASGGHTALRLGDTVFHFQHDGDVFRLERQRWESFEREYRRFQNRPLHLMRLPLEGRTLERLRDHLNAAHLDQLRRLRERQAARRDRRLLEALSGDALGVPVTAAGLVDPARTDDPYAEMLRRRIEAQLGESLETRLMAAEAMVQAAIRATTESPSPQAPRRARDALAYREALQALVFGHGIAADAIIDPEAEGIRLPPLGPTERSALATAADRLATRGAALAESSRPDRGVALLRLHARWIARQDTLAEGRWRVLDPYGDLAPIISASEARSRSQELNALSDEGLRLLSGERLSVMRGEPAESALQRIEELLGRSVEAARGARGLATRDATYRLLPSRSREVRVTLPPGAPAPEEALNEADTRLRQVEAKVQRLDGYDLLTRNCATELQRVLVAGLGGPEAEREFLGGNLHPGEALTFIPWRYFEVIRERYRTTHEVRLAAYREQLLAARYHDQQGLVAPAWSYLRETVVPTSTFYTPRDRDGTFLVFTDDARWLRPVWGVANLLAGLGDASLGVLTAPVDRGQRLTRGGRGMLFSLPELVFGNIRKGSFDLSTLPSLERCEGASAETCAD